MSPNHLQHMTPKVSNQLANMCKQIVTRKRPMTSKTNSYFLALLAAGASEEDPAATSDAARLPMILFCSASCQALSCAAFSSASGSRVALACSTSFAAASGAAWASAAATSASFAAASKADCSAVTSAEMSSILPSSCF